MCDNGGIKGITRMSSMALSPCGNGVSLYERVSYNGKVVYMLHISHEEHQEHQDNKILEKSSIDISIPRRFREMNFEDDTKEEILDEIPNFEKYREYTEIVYSEDKPTIIRKGEKT